MRLQPRFFHVCKNAAEAACTSGYTDSFPRYVISFNSNLVLIEY